MAPERRRGRVIAATVTPLTRGGRDVDVAAIAPYVEYLVARGVDGMFVLGTTGEGFLLTEAERFAVTEAYMAAAGGRAEVIVHAGAQTTAETVRLAEHAAALGVDGVAVLPPPYYSLTDVEIYAHLAAAGAACASVPYYLYEFADRSGYAIPLDVIAQLHASCPNLCGIKVSDAAESQFERYLGSEVPVYAGPEWLIPTAMRRGAAGVVSGLAAALPDYVGSILESGSGELAEAASSLRRAIAPFGFESTMKALLQSAGLPIRPDVRPPLRTLSAAEVAGAVEAVRGWKTALGQELTA